MTDREQVKKNLSFLLQDICRRRLEYLPDREPYLGGVYMKWAEEVLTLVGYPPPGSEQPVAISKNRLKVEIDTYLSGPSRCRIWYDDILQWEGQDLSATSSATYAGTEDH